jgi:NADPH:quinone reductase-like Zn-dependent oxidoreductase
MNAAVLSSYGATDVIQHVKDRPVPVLEPDQVLIRVRACALAPLDTQVRDPF